MLPQALEQASCSDFAGAEATFTSAEHIGGRFADADLISLARQGRGRVLVEIGRVTDGMALFDEVMVAVTAGEVTPIVSGVVYCSVISACFEMLDIRRAQEWTEALNDWCEAQPGLAPYRGECLVHRAEIFRLRGPQAGGVTPREVEVLRLIAQGKTNRAIAGELDISEKTIARHVSNIFTKLDLSTRTAATAYAFTHHLVRPT
jgi:DNA-binding CsgD family transcriptional regulator